MDGGGCLVSAVKSYKRSPPKGKKTPSRVGKRRFVSVTLGLALSVMTIWTYFHGAALFSQGMEHVETLFASLGFQLDDVVVEGRIRTDKTHILKTANLSRGKSLFSIDLVQVKNKLEEVPWVNAVSVERRFPDTLFIRISEREPVAIWQNKSQLYLVDREGGLIQTKENKYGGLLRISGLQAPKHIGALVVLLDKFPEIKNRVTAAIHLRSTRWDIQLDGRVMIKLPERDAEKALAYLLDLENHHHLMDREILNIDLRIPDQLILRLTPEGAQMRDGTGKDA